MVETHSNQAVEVHQETEEGAEGDRAKRYYLSEDQHQVTDHIIAALNDHDDRRIRALIKPLIDAEISSILGHLSDDQRRRVVRGMGRHFRPEILPLLDEEIQSSVVEELGMSKAANALGDLKSDDVVSVMENLEDDVRDNVLSRLSLQDQGVLKDSLSYLPDSAGRLMQREYVHVPGRWNVGRIIDYLRQDGNLPNDFYDIFVVDDRGAPLGSLPLSHILRSKREVLIKDIVDADIRPIPLSMDQEEIAFLFRKRDLTSHPVVDHQGRMVGIITIDDIVDVIDDEAQEDIMRLGGVQGDYVHSTMSKALLGRFSWLLLNLVFTFAAAAVISLFTDSISQLVVLAVLMPIVASMGGIAAVQTMTITVRALAMKELVRANRWRMVGRECLVAISNGSMLATVAGIATWLWYQEMGLSIVVFLALLANVSLAGSIGILVPLAIARIGFDPAVASGPCITVMADIFGFLAFLGLATFLLI